jgi:hypothetical protein
MWHVWCFSHHQWAYGMTQPGGCGREERFIRLDVPVGSGAVQIRTPMVNTKQAIDSPELWDGRSLPSVPAEPLPLSIRQKAFYSIVTAHEGMRSPTTCGGVAGVFWPQRECWGDGVVGDTIYTWHRNRSSGNVRDDLTSLEGVSRIASHTFALLPGPAVG